MARSSIAILFRSTQEFRSPLRKFPSMNDKGYLTICLISFLLTLTTLQVNGHEKLLKPWIKSRVAGACPYWSEVPAYTYARCDVLSSRVLRQTRTYVNA